MWAWGPSQLLLLLPAPDLQPLQQPGLRGGLHAEGHLQEAGRRDRPGRPEPLQGLPPLRQGVPLQEGVLEPRGRAVPEVHFLLSQAELQRVGETPAQFAARRGGNFCVTQCVGRIRWVGYYEPAKGPAHADNLRYNVNRLVDQYQVALRLHPEFGTTPNTFYIPPLSPPVNGGTAKRIPVATLAKMFGDTCAQTQVQREARINGSSPSSNRKGRSLPPASLRRWWTFSHRIPKQTEFRSEGTGGEYENAISEYSRMRS